MEIAAFTLRFHSYNQFGISENRDVCVVTGKNELPPTLAIPHLRDDVSADELVVEIVFRLINDQGHIGFKQEKEKDRGCFLTGRKIFEATPVFGAFIARDVEFDFGLGKKLKLLNLEEELS